MTAKVTVIVPIYNSQKHLGRCLRSLDEQSLPKSDLQVILVDDGSDNPVVVDQKRYGFGIKLIRHKENKGLPAAINTALNRCETRFFVRVDSDDYVHQSFLEIMLLVFFQNPSIWAVACDYKLVDIFENVISVENCQEQPIGCGLMLRTDVLIETGLFNPNFLMAEEIEFRQRLDRVCQVHRLPIPLYRYVRHENNMTNDKERYDHFKGKLGE